MKYISWILLAPIVVVAAVFAAHNNDPQVLDFWPLPLTFDVPVYGIVLGAIAIGFFAGVVVTWLAARGTRQKSRRRRRELANLSKEVESLKQPAEVLPPLTSSGSVPSVSPVPPTRTDPKD